MHHVKSLDAFDGLLHHGYGAWSRLYGPIKRESHRQFPRAPPRKLNDGPHPIWDEIIYLIYMGFHALDIYFWDLFFGIFFGMI